jgi:hypothetical protein
MKPKESTMTTSNDAADAMRRTIQEGYSAIARVGGWSTDAIEAAVSGRPASSCCTPGGGCCGPATFSPAQLATAIGYSAEELAAAPESANMGLSCGNPTAIASLKPGEVVLDLGAGGVFDCFSFVFEHEGLRVGHSSDIGDVNDLEPLLQAPLDLLVCELSHVSPAELFLKLRGRSIGRLVFVHLSRELWAERTALKSQARRALGSAIPVSVAGDGDVFRI